MKNRLLQFLALLMASTVMFSCQDEFTEEDALEAQQLIDLAIYVFDQGSDNQDPVAGATVRLVQGSESREVVTDESGSALFTDAKIGGFIYTVSGTDFTSVTEEGSVSTSNFRQGQETFSVGVYLNTNTDNFSTLRGRISIEKDLTNELTEYADGIELLAVVYLTGETKTFTATTDADGRYEFSLPSRANNGTSIDLRFPDLEIDQTIAYNRLSTESGSFPEVLPSVIQYPTLFSMYTGGRTNYDNFNTNINPVYAIVEEAPETGTTAVISNVIVNSDGEITGVNFSNGGDYTDDADGTVTVTFTSLLGGSGATLSYDVTGAFTNLASIDCCDQAMRTLEGGSGYPDYDVNYNGYEGPTVNSSNRVMGFYLYPGTTTVFNADYGTGVYREDNLD